jgi:hypothetical protein
MNARKPDQCHPNFSTRAAVNRRVITEVLADDDRAG